MREWATARVTFAVCLFFSFFVRLFVRWLVGSSLRLCVGLFFLCFCSVSSAPPSANHRMHHPSPSERTLGRESFPKTPERPYSSANPLMACHRFAFTCFRIVLMVVFVCLSVSFFVSLFVSLVRHWHRRSWILCVLEVFLCLLIVVSLFRLVENNFESLS